MRFSIVESDDLSISRYVRRHILIREARAVIKRMRQRSNWSLRSKRLNIIIYLCVIFFTGI